MSERRTALGRRLVAATILGVLVFAGLSLYGDVRALAANLRRFDPSVLLPALGLATANYAVRFVRWQYYLRRIDVPVPSGQSALVFLAGFVMSITPGKVGEVYKSLLLRELRGVPVLRTAPIVVAERLTDLVALVLLTAVGALAFARGVPVAAGGAAVVAILLLTAAWRPMGELGLGVLARLPLLGRAAPRAREAYESLHAMTRPAPLMVATSLATLAWWLECIALYMLARGFPGVDLSLTASSFAYAAPTIMGALALVPGGLGVTEAGMTGVLQALGGPAMGPAVATATTMLVRLATLWWAVLLGVGALAVLRHRARQGVADAPGEAVPDEP